MKTIKKLWNKLPMFTFYVWKKQMKISSITQNLKQVELSQFWTSSDFFTIALATFNLVKYSSVLDIVFTKKPCNTNYACNSNYSKLLYPHLFWKTSSLLVWKAYQTCVTFILKSLSRAFSLKTFSSLFVKKLVKKKAKSR